MNYKDYVQLSTDDLLNHQDEIDLSSASLKIPSLLHQWSVYHVNERIALREIERMQSEWYKIMWNYYMGKLSEEELREYNLKPFPHKLLKQQVDIWINADQKLNDIEDKRVAQQQIVDFIERKMKELSNRQWAVKTAMDYRKFITGA
jgi:hypothetical protein